MPRGLRDWFRSITDVRPGEFFPAGVMFGYGFLALTSHYLAKSVRNATFVQRVGAEDLDVIYILSAVLVTVVMAVYSRFVDRVGQRSLLQGSFAVLASVLVLFWWLLRGGSGGVLTSGAFYLFVKLYGLLLVSQFWLVANLLFSTRQAKRLFGPIGAGLILGAIFGGALANGAVGRVGSENLLLLSAGALALCGAAVHALGDRIEEGGEASGRLMADLTGDALDVLRESPHLRGIALILGLTIVVSTFVDWQLNTAVQMYVEGEDAMTAFWGTFFALQNTGAIIVQVLLTGFVLRRFGIGTALLALPVGLLIATVGVIAVPSLLAAALLKGTEGGLRFSLDQSTRELLFLPVPNEVKYKAKPLIDLAVFRGGTGVAGLILLGLTDGLGLGLRGVALVSLLFVGAWMVSTLRMRREYRSSIRRLIGVRDMDVSEQIYQRLDAGTLEELRHTLRSGSSEEVLYALALLEEVAPPALEDDLLPLLRHESAEVRAKTLEILFSIGTGELVERVRPLLRDPSVDVRAEAIHFICEFSDEPASDQMDDFLREENEEVRAAALSCLIRHGNAEQITMGLASLRALAETEEPSLREEAARMIGEMGQGRPDESLRLLRKLVQDPVPEVRHRALASAARVHRTELLDLMLQRLQVPADREATREALAELGSEVHGALLEHLRSGELPRAVLRQLPQLFFTEARQEDVDGLVELLPALESGTLRYHVVKVLDRLRRDRGDLDFERYDVRELVRRECREGHRHALYLADLRSAPEPLSPLLGRLLDQRRLEAIERATRALGLRYPLQDLVTANKALRAPDQLTRERGFELLDTLLPHPYREWFDPLANPEAGHEERAVAAVERFGFERRSRVETLAEMSDGPDFWLAILARVEAGRDPRGWSSRGEFVERLRADTLLGQEPLPPEGEIDMMDIIERAEFLRRTELFGRLRTEDLAALAALTREASFEAGELIFPEGATGCDLYIVVEGRVEARRRGRTILVAEPGQTVGDLALLDGLPTHYEARARESVRALVLDREDFFSLLEERFRVARDVLSYMAGLVRELEPAREGDPVRTGGG